MGCVSVGEPDTDMAGTGILIAFIGQAFISLALSLFLGLQKLSNPEKDNLEPHSLETRAFRVHFPQGGKWREIVKKLLMAGSDAQSVIGISLLIAAISKVKTTSLYHLHIVYDTLNCTSITHTAAIACAFSRDMQLKGIRLSLILIFLSLYLAFICLFGIRLNDWDNTVPGNCYDTSLISRLQDKHPIVDHVYLSLTSLYLFLNFGSALLAQWPEHAQRLIPQEALNRYPILRQSFHPLVPLDTDHQMASASTSYTLLLYFLQFFPQRCLDLILVARVRLLPRHIAENSLKIQLHNTIERTSNKTLLTLLKSVREGPMDESLLDSRVPQVTLDHAQNFRNHFRKELSENRPRNFSDLQRLIVIRTALFLLMQSHVQELNVDREHSRQYELFILLIYKYFDMLGKCFSLSEKVDAPLSLNNILITASVQFPLHVYSIIALRVSNAHLLSGGAAGGETQWSFGQIIAVVLLAQNVLEFWKEYTENRYASDLAPASELAEQECAENQKQRAELVLTSH